MQLLLLLLVGVGVGVSDHAYDQLYVDYAGQGTKPRIVGELEAIVLGGGCFLLGVVLLRYQIWYWPAEVNLDQAIVVLAGRFPGSQ